MRELFRFLASLKFGITLLVLIVIALATGTIVESIHGASLALARIYTAFWFKSLLGVFALNVACSLIELWPWGWKRAGFVLTHSSMLLVLLGALVTDRARIEGRLPIWEGETNGVVLQEDGGSFELPFVIQLNAFELDYYPGTRRPAQFRSRVVVHNPQASESLPAVIEMNKELSYGGYKFFQSSYEQTPERERTILMVSKDPGQPIVFAGYTLLMLGMLTVLVTRMAQRRAAALLAAPSKPTVRRVAAILVALGLSAALPGPATAAQLPDAESVERVRRLPVQHDGRVMPFDTLAREAVWKVTGEWSWQGIDPVALAAGWALDAQGWASEPMIELPGAEFSLEAGVPPSLTHASFNTLASNQRVIQLVKQARTHSNQDLPLTPALQQALKLESRLVWLQRFMRHEIIRSVPDISDPTAQWSTPSPMKSVDELMESVRTSAQVTDSAAISKEISYNRVRPSRLAWWILLVSTGVAVFAWTKPRRWLDGLAVGGLAAGFIVMTWGLWTRWQVAGRIPASNMYESLLFLAWGVGLFALVAFIFMKSRLVVLNASAMSTLTMLLADVLPIDPFIHPMPPVLSGTPWLAIHVPIIMVSYSALALGVLVAHMQIGVGMFATKREDLVRRMTELLYWYMHVGAFLLIAGILTGSIWAASSWGRYWGWDPKEVWSLIAFLAYLAILHGRLDKVIGPFGMAAASIVGFWMVLMTYIGVNYVLASGLHSYGFGDSGVVRWMTLLAGLEVVFLAGGWYAMHVKRNRTAGLRTAEGSS